MVPEGEALIQDLLARYESAVRAAVEYGDTQESIRAIDKIIKEAWEEYAEAYWRAYKRNAPSPPIIR